MVAASTTADIPSTRGAAFAPPPPPPPPSRGPRTLVVGTDGAKAAASATLPRVAPPLALRADACAGYAALLTGRLKEAVRGQRAAASLSLAQQERRRCASLCVLTAAESAALQQAYSKRGASGKPGAVGFGCRWRRGEVWTEGHLRRTLALLERVAAAAAADSALSVDELLWETGRTASPLEAGPEQLTPKLRASARKMGRLAEDVDDTLAARAAERRRLSDETNGSRVGARADAACGRPPAPDGVQEHEWATYLLIKSTRPALLRDDSTHCGSSQSRGALPPLPRWPYVPPTCPERTTLHCPIGGLPISVELLASDPAGSLSSHTVGSTAIAFDGLDSYDRRLRRVRARQTKFFS